MKIFIENITLLSERPGLQNITYSAIFDCSGMERLVPSLCEKALQHKDAYVNILADFMLDLKTLNPLFSGHKPTTAMIDTRTV